MGDIKCLRQNHQGSFSYFYFTLLRFLVFQFGILEQALETKFYFPNHHIAFSSSLF